MRILVLVATLAFAVCAAADDKKKVPVKRVDMASPMAQAVTDEEIEAGPNRGTLAQDYNSSRSNNESRAQSQDYNSSRSNNESRASVDGDYNSSRSNNINAADSGGGDYNSSRSSKTHTSKLDPDSDGDSIDADCGNGVDDDCDGIAVAPPANHNTTRSNRTSE